ncbi:MAG TPA: GMC family oxidoreductase [Ramlibacter sp.]
MIIDYAKDRQLPEYDACVLGAGPAGITVALQLSAAGWKVGLLEAGGLEFSEHSQALYAAKAPSSLNLPWNRLRFFGGTSNHWSGRCRPFDASDFEFAPLNGVPGWPLRYAEAARYLRPAMQILDLPAEGFKAVNGPLDQASFAEDRYALSPPTRFAAKYLQAIRDSRRIDLVLNCNCTELRFVPGTRRVDAVLASDYEGRKSSVRAKTFVVALGGIENARLLLASESLRAHGAGGPMLGRCFMEHLNVELGEFVFANEGTTTAVQYYTTAAFARSQQIGVGNVSLNPVTEVISYGRTAKVKTFLKTLACDMGVAQKVQFVANFACPGAGLVTTLLEQSPEPSNRIVLSGDRDKLGMPTAEISWSLSDADVRTIRVIGMEVAKGFSRSGLGYMRLRDYVLQPGTDIPVSPHAHHMGTTRMAAEPRWGVVDTDCKVFGTNNLYVAGSSIFSTGGGCNPTLPILQFALRLSDHLKARGLPAPNRAA